MPQDPRRLACWRFERISPLLDEHLTAAQRSRHLLAISRVVVEWPSGRQERIAPRTLRRWLAAYLKTRNLEALMPAQHARAPARRMLTGVQIEFALGFLEQDPKRSLYQCLTHLALKFDLVRPPSRATLQRALRAQPRYLRLRKRARGLLKVCVRFMASRPHELWQADAKAKFTFRFTTGIVMEITILTILDDFSRYVLAALLWARENEAAAVGTFRHAAAIWGLPAGFYADRGSCYDSDLFRQGLALLGVRRVGTRPRNPQAHGKIEAYHRVLQRWFINELKHQLVHDLAQLQELLNAVLQELYLPHYHREIRTSPQAALAGIRSNRPASLERLREVFLGERCLAICRRTATVRLGPSTIFRVPDELRLKKKIVVLVDPQYPNQPYLRDARGTLVPLQPALPRHPKPPTPPPATPELPPGSLTPLLEKYRGRLLR
jgi:transposase InsO family protein